MAINLTGPTAAITTNKLTTATYTFVADLALDGRSKVAVVSALGGTQTGVNVHTVDAPKMMIFRKPAVFSQPSGYNVTTGRYAKVPKNIWKVTGRMSCSVAAGQVELIPIELSIGIPAGAMTYDRANVEASIAAFVGGVQNQLVALIQATYDGLI